VLCLIIFKFNFTPHSKDNKVTSLSFAAILGFSTARRVPWDRNVLETHQSSHTPRSVLK